MRSKLSVCIKAATVISVILGVSLSLVFAVRDGYSHPSSRLLYFTALSNICMALMFLAMLADTAFDFFENRPRVKRTIYILRFIFTVSITLTGFIFCAVLAPGAGNADYDAWTFSNVVTHIIVPVLSIADMFVDPYRTAISKRDVFLSTVPPFIYLIFVSILVLLKVDFGRGDPYPYIFFNYYSPAGFFGFSNQMPYIFGSFYWMILILAVILGVGFLYKKLYNKQEV